MTGECASQASRSPGREIERADHLRHADARLAGRARIAVGHVGGGLLAVGVDALDVGAPSPSRRRSAAAPPAP